MLALVSGFSRSSSSEQCGLFDLAEDVGDPVGRHAGKQLCGCFSRHQRDEFWFTFRPRLVDDFNGAIGRQMKENRNCEFWRHVVEGFDDIGRTLVDHACGE
jgi:hypothetical protein